MARTKSSMREALRKDPNTAQIRAVYQKLDTSPISVEKTKILRERVMGTAKVWQGPGKYMFEGRIHMAADCIDDPVAQHILVSCQEFLEPPVCSKLLDGFYLSYELTEKIGDCPAYYLPDGEQTLADSQVESLSGAE